jgi:hypothetical protein
MDLFLLQVVSAFLLFAVILPLAGVAIGLFCYYVLPYLFGAVISVGLAIIAGVQFLFTWWVWLFSLVWATAVYFVRMKFRQLGEDVEHYRAAHATLLGGLPYRRMKQQRECVASEG